MCVMAGGCALSEQRHGSARSGRIRVSRRLLLLVGHGGSSSMRRGELERRWCGVAIRLRSMSGGVRMRVPSGAASGGRVSVDVVAVSVGIKCGMTGRGGIFQHRRASHRSRPTHPPGALSL